MMKNQNELENIATKIIAKSGIQPKEEHGSVILVLMVISIILTIVRVIQECDKDQSNDFYFNRIKTLSKKRSWLTQLKLKRILKRQLRYEDYKQYKDGMLTAILDVADELTEDQVSLMIEAEKI